MEIEYRIIEIEDKTAKHGPMLRVKVEYQRHTEWMSCFVKEEIDTIKANVGKIVKLETKENTSTDREGNKKTFTNIIEVIDVMTEKVSEPKDIMKEYNTADNCELMQSITLYIALCKRDDFIKAIEANMQDYEIMKVAIDLVKQARKDL